MSFYLDEGKSKELGIVFEDGYRSTCVKVKTFLRVLLDCKESRTKSRLKLYLHTLNDFDDVQVC